MKITLKKALSLLLALAMLLSLCACGEKQKSETQTPQSTDAAQSEAEEYVYSARHISLPEDFIRDYTPLALTENGLYLAGYIKVGEDIPEGKTPEYEGQYDIKQPRLCFMGSSGEIETVEAYTPLIPDTDSEDRKNYRSSVSLCGLFVSDDGSFTVLENLFESWDEDESLCSAEHYYMRKLATDGTELSSALLKTPEGGYIDTYSGQLDSSGRLLLVGSDAEGESCVLVFDSAGELLQSVPFNGYIYSSAKLRCGGMVLLGYDPEGTSGWLTVKTLDTETMSLEALPVTVGDDSYKLFDGCGDYDFYYCSNSRLFGCNVDGEGSEELLNWLDCDIDSGSLHLLGMDGEGDFHGLIYDFDSEYFSLSRLKADEVSEKEHISLAALYADTQLKKAVISFNRSSDKYHIDLTDYYDFNSAGDWTAGQTKLLTEIMAGDAPDIIALSEMPYSQLAAKGLLEDLKPYIERDSEIELDDFFPNVTAALEINGGLYSVCPGFSVQTAVGAASVVGTEPGLSYDEYFAALEKMPEGCEGFDYGVDRNTILQISLALDFDHYVDWENGTCSFNSDDFVALLNYAASFPEPITDYNVGAEGSSAARIASGKQLLATAGFSSTDYFVYDYDAMFGGEASFVGFPTISGVGSVIYLSDSYAMSSSCKNKDAAWEFMRLFLTEDYQEDIYGLPTNKNAFEKSLAKAMEVEYEKDANGNYLLDENGERIQVSKGCMYDGYSYYNVYATTPEQAQQLREVIATAEKRFDFDQSISDIVIEGAAAFFAGQKSAEECARLIQSKASIFISEQR